MNRTSLCIKMLQLLKARGKMNSKALAEELETNQRNIREFRNELITAGYNIKETRGRYGGYELDEDCIFPTLRLTDEEIKALDESRHLITSHHEYTLYKEYNDAVDKIMQMTHDTSRSTNIFMDTPGIELTQKEIEMFTTLNKAIETSHCVLLNYQGSKDDAPVEFLLDPYEIIHYHQAYYVVGFSHRRNDIRIYRVSKERMFDCALQDRKFLKDSQFKLENYIGKHSIIKGNYVKVKCKVNKEKRRMFKEAYWGMDFQEEAHENYSIFTFITEDLLSLYRQIFSFGDAVELLEPAECKESYVQSLKTILNLYK